MTDGLLEVVAAYADQLAAADELGQHDSMSAAQALESLYEDRGWVAEFLRVKPRPASGRGGNNWREDSRSRFSQWVMWKLEQEGRTPLVNRRTYQLLDAAQVARHLNLNQVQIQTERTTRPLKWLLKHDYADRIPDVWRIAVELAGSSDRVTGEHVRRAMQQWKHDALGARGIRSAIKSSRARTLRIKAFADIRALVDIGTPEAQQEYRQLLHDVKDLVDQKQAKPDLKVVS